MKRVRLIALDMDGTLLSSDHQRISTRFATQLRKEYVFASVQGVCLKMPATSLPACSSLA